MGHQAISGIAALVVLAFITMALAACSTSAQRAIGARPNAAVASIPSETPATPEFHDAHIAQDALRDRLPSES